MCLFDDDRGRVPAAAYEVEEVFDTNLGLLQTLELGTHYLKEEVFLCCQRLRMVLVGIGDVGEADGGVFAFGLGAVFQFEGVGYEEELECAVVCHCEC